MGFPFTLLMVSKEIQPAILRVQGQTVLVSVFWLINLLLCWSQIHYGIQVQIHFEVEAFFVESPAFSLLIEKHLLNQLSVSITIPVSQNKIWALSNAVTIMFTECINVDIFTIIIREKEPQNTNWLITSLSAVEVTLILLRMCPEGNERELACKPEPLCIHVWHGTPTCQQSPSLCSCTKNHLLIDFLKPNTILLLRQQQSVGPQRLWRQSNICLPLKVSLIRLILSLASLVLVPPLHTDSDAEDN